MRSVALLAALTLVGCQPFSRPTKAPLTLDGLPWAIKDAEEKLLGKTKEEVIALFGKPDQVTGSTSDWYVYIAPKYLKADIGAKDQLPTGLELRFNNNRVVLVSRP